MRLIAGLSRQFDRSNWPCKLCRRLEPLAITRGTRFAAPATVPDKLAVTIDHIHEAHSPALRGAVLVVAIRHVASTRALLSA